jgi:hypothetical protein
VYDDNEKYDDDDCDGDDDNDDECVWCRMCVKITYSHKCCSLLIILLTKVHDYYFVGLYCH